jgi:hypothetical protein
MHFAPQATEQWSVGGYDAPDWAQADSWKISLEVSPPEVKVTFVPEGYLGCDDHVRDYLLVMQIHLIQHCCCSPRWTHVGCEDRELLRRLVLKRLYALQAVGQTSLARYWFLKRLVALREAWESTGV